uniref:ATP synthase complex subunit 8 n=1 Tax=Corynis sp. TaxID=2983160 RepID=A0A977TJR7_9HYME|nr:ATP synthase F0 subunit 8 [Corynis sp.]
MPQMFPLNWISLYFYFIIILYMFNILLYHDKTYMFTKKSKKLNFSLKLMNWKW